MRDRIEHRATVVCVCVCSRALNSTSHHLNVNYETDTWKRRGGRSITGNARRHGSLPIAHEPNTPRTTLVPFCRENRGMPWSIAHANKDLYARDFNKPMFNSPNQHTLEHCPDEARNNNLRFGTYKGQNVRPLIGSWSPRTWTSFACPLESLFLARKRGGRSQTPCKFVCPAGLTPGATD